MLFSGRLCNGDHLHAELGGASRQGAQHAFSVAFLVVVLALIGRINGKPRPEQDAILGEPWPELARGQKSQLVVSVTDPKGVTASYTKVNRISFAHFGCLTINKNGVMTVTPSGTCAMPDAPVLLVGYYDSTGKPVTYSEFLFKVRP